MKRRWQLLTGDIGATDDGDPDGFYRQALTDAPVPRGTAAALASNSPAPCPNTRQHRRIVGRIKELIVTAGGENIPPVLIEASIKERMPAIA